MADKVRLLVKEHVRDPGSMETVYRGVGDYDPEVAYRLLSAHSGTVEELDAESLESKNKDEVVQVAKAAGVEVDPSDKKEDIARQVAKK